MPIRRRILFLCTGNSSRSQMAEGVLRHLFPDRYEALSAGSDPSGFVHPLAILAMGEIGVDVTGQRSKSIAEFVPPDGAPPHVLIALCANAARKCPAFPAAVERLDWPFDDPGHVQGTEAERLAAFRVCRDALSAAIQRHFGARGAA